MINFLKTLSKQFEYDLLKSKVTAFLRDCKERIHYANARFSPPELQDPSTSISKTSSLPSHRDAFFAQQTFSSKIIEEVIPESHESQEYSKHSDEALQSQQQAPQDVPTLETPEFGLFKTRNAPEHKSPAPELPGNPFITKTNLPPLPYEAALQKQVQEDLRREEENVQRLKEQLR